MAEPPSNGLLTERQGSQQHPLAISMVLRSPSLLTFSPLVKQADQRKLSEERCLVFQVPLAGGEPGPGSMGVLL